VLCASVFSKPGTLRQVSAALLSTFQLDPSSAVLLLRAQAGFAGGEVTAAANAAAADAALASDSARRHAAHDSRSLRNSAATAAAGAAKLRAAAGHPLLPRMPLLLQYLSSMESYKAAAGVARALGRSARMADTQQQAAAIAGTGCRGVEVLERGCAALLVLAANHFCASARLEGHWGANTCAASAWYRTLFKSIPTGSIFATTFCSHHGWAVQRCQQLHPYVYIKKRT
jgi:hypothetical protein